MYQYFRQETTVHLKFRNINDAFAEMVRGIHTGAIPTEKQTSRNGAVLQIPEPVILTYSNPAERVLFSAARDASPFLSVYEALYMLAGRNDVSPLAFYAKQMNEYSDDGKTLNGSYGYRWRNAKHDDGSGYTIGTTDQLEVLVAHLKAKPDSRRAVLQMWNVGNDLLKVNSSKDTACNLSVLFSLREHRFPDGMPNMGDGDLPPYLDITVFNRSNDLVWGALGANYCLSGDTVIASPEGNTSVRDLSERFVRRDITKYPVYSFDTESKKMKVSWCTKAWKTGKKAVIEVGFDDGSFVRMTKDHRLFSKKWNDRDFCQEVKAGALKVGDRVWAGSVCTFSGGRKAFTKRLGVSTSNGNISLVARAYWELVNGPIPAGYHIHHKDEDKGNDTISNLEMLTAFEHLSHHKTRAEYSTETKAKMSQSRKAYFANMTEDQLEAYREARRGYTASADSKKKMSAGQKGFWAGRAQAQRKAHGLKIKKAQAGMPRLKSMPGKKHTPETIAKMAETRRLFWEAKKSNHKVTSIRELGLEEVYDFTVPGDSNAMLENGVVVHNCTFSVLMEYVAAKLGARVGRYNQVSNNMHVYDWNFKPQEWLADATPDGYVEGLTEPIGRGQPLNLVPLVKDPATFDREVVEFVERFSGKLPAEGLAADWAEPFLRDVAQPMLIAFACHKAKDYHSALMGMESILADDWRVAATSWLRRRAAKHERSK